MKGNILRMLNESEKRRIVGMHTSHKNQKLDDEAKRLSKLFGYRINESAIRGYLITESLQPGENLNFDNDWKGFWFNPTEPELSPFKSNTAKWNQFKSTGYWAWQGSDIARLLSYIKAYNDIKKSKPDLLNKIAKKNGEKGLYDFPEFYPYLNSASENVTCEVSMVDVYPRPGATTVLTLGYLNNSGDFSRPGVESGVYLNPLISYINRWNLVNIIPETFRGPTETVLTFAYQADFLPTTETRQYDLSQMLDSNNAVDLMKVVSMPNTLILYSTTQDVPSVGGKEVEVKNVGAQSAVDEQYDISFDAGKAEVNTNDPEVVRAYNDFIKYFPDGNVTNITILSSASPEFNSGAGGPKTLADYAGKETNGTGNPGAGSDNFTKNFELAYNRGVNFINALNTLLANNNKPQITNPTINWQISDKGGKKVLGRYATIEWSKAAVPGKNEKNLKNTGTAGSNENVGKTYQVYKYTWKF